MRVITGICVVLALAASGCTQAAEPTTLPEPSVSASASPPPSTDRPWPTSTPTTPATAAQEALVAYFRSANDAARGSDLALHRTTYAPTCAACVAATADFAAAQSENLAADDDRYASWVISIEEEELDQVVLLSVIDFAPISLVGSDGAVVDRVPGLTDETFVWTVARQPSGDWLVVQGQRLA